MRLDFDARLCHCHFVATNFASLAFSFRPSHDVEDDHDDEAMRRWRRWLNVVRFMLMFISLTLSFVFIYFLFTLTLFSVLANGFTFMHESERFARFCESMVVRCRRWWRCQRTSQLVPVVCFYGHWDIHSQLRRVGNFCDGVAFHFQR